MYHHDPKEWARIDNWPVCLLCMHKFQHASAIKLHIQSEHDDAQRKVAGYSNKVGLHIVGNDV